MDVELNRGAKQIVGNWLLGMSAALQVSDTYLLAVLLRPDCDWRDIVALTWTIETVSGREPVARHLHRELEHTRIDDHDQQGILTSMVRSSG